jgi:hypothetical protein
MSCRVPNTRPGFPSLPSSTRARAATQPVVPSRLIDRAWNSYSFASSMASCSDATTPARSSGWMNSKNFSQSTQVTPGVVPAIAISFSDQVTSPVFRFHVQVPNPARLSTRAARAAASATSASAVQRASFSSITATD